jgi:cyclophilin family peptidyl-prolyl cis-trans isomerase
MSMRPSPQVIIEQLEQRALLSIGFATALDSEYHFTSQGAITIGIDGDTDGGPVVIDAVSDNPNISVQAVQGTKIATLHFTDYENTSLGDIQVVLFPDRAPLAVQRFIDLATQAVVGGSLESGTPFYTDVSVHRIIDGFMFQTGDKINGNGTGGSGLGDFEDEFYEPLTFAGHGVLAMANSGPDTNDSQFFITDGPAAWLNYVHTIFGHVISGWDTLDAIMSTPVTGQTPDHAPILTSIDIADTQQDGYLIVSANAGYSGSAGITVTLTNDDTGETTQQQFDADALGARPTIPIPATVTVGRNGTATYTLTDDGPFGLALQSNTSNQNVHFTFDDVSGVLTITAPADYYGMISITLSAVEKGFSDVMATTKTFYLVAQNADEPQILSRLPNIADDDAPMGTCVSGDRLYVASGSKGLRIFSLANPAVPVYLGGYDTAGFARDVLVVGDTAYVADEAGGLVVLNVANPSAVTKSGSIATVGPAIDVAVRGGVAFVAEYDAGFSSYDVSNPASIHLLQNIKTIAENFDFRHATSVELKGDYAWVVEMGDTDLGYGGGLISFNITNPSAMWGYSAMAANGFPFSLEIVGNLGYMADQWRGLLTADLTNPAAPTLLAATEVQNGQWQLKIVNHMAIVAGNGTYAFVDVTNPRSLETNYTLTQPSQYTGRPASYGKYLYLPMRSDGIMVMDASNVVLRQQFTGKRIILDSHNVPVTVELKGAGKVYVYTTGFDTGDIWQLRVIGSDYNSKLTISSPYETNIGSIVVTGALKELSAKRANITNGLAVGGSIRTMTTLDFWGALQVYGAGGPSTMKFRRLMNATINSPYTGIERLTINEWLDSDAPDVLTAPWVKYLTCYGNFQADLNLTSSYGGWALKEGKISGSLNNANWSFGGAISYLKAGAIDSSWTGNLGYLKKLDVSGNFSGNLTAGTIGTMTVKGGMYNAYLRLNQTTDAAYLGSYALKELKVTGSIDGSQVISRGHVKKIGAGAILNSTVFVGDYGGPSIGPDAILLELSAKAFGNVDVFCHALPKLKLGYVYTSTGASHGLNARSYGSLTWTSPTTGYHSWTNRYGGAPAGEGDFTISVL